MIYLIGFILVVVTSFSMYSATYAIKVSAIMALFCLMHIVFDKLNNKKVF